jgi:hypothetical protein
MSDQTCPPLPKVQTLDEVVAADESVRRAEKQFRLEVAALHAEEAERGRLCASISTLRREAKATSHDPDRVREILAEIQQADVAIRAIDEVHSAVRDERIQQANTQYAQAYAEVARRYAYALEAALPQFDARIRQLEAALVEARDARTAAARLHQATAGATVEPRPLEGLPSEVEAAVLNPTPGSAWPIRQTREFLRPFVEAELAGCPTFLSIALNRLGEVTCPNWREKFNASLHSALHARLTAHVAEWERNLPSHVAAEQRMKSAGAKPGIHRTLAIS